MINFQIENTVSGRVLGVYEASNPDDALDAMAKDAGYDSYADLCSVAPPEDNEILVTEVCSACG